MDGFSGEIQLAGPAAGPVSSCHCTMNGISVVRRLPGIMSPTDALDWFQAAGWCGGGRGGSVAGSVCVCVLLMQDWGAVWPTEYKWSRHDASPDNVGTASIHTPQIHKFTTTNSCRFSEAFYISSIATRWSPPPRPAFPIILQLKFLSRASLQFTCRAPVACGTS